MLNWFTYGGLDHDMSQQVVFIIAQILAVLIGVLGLSVFLYGLFKLHLRDKWLTGLVYCKMWFPLQLVESSYSYC